MAAACGTTALRMMVLRVLWLMVLRGLASVVADGLARAFEDDGLESVVADGLARATGGVAAQGALVRVKLAALCD